jgi:hypothetical protein
MNHSNWKKLVRIGLCYLVIFTQITKLILDSIVPSLLKRWKRLESGLDASAQAYKALSSHSKGKTKQWLKEDNTAQKNRQAFLASMDIYDTIKEKGVDIYPYLLAHC